MACLHGHKYHSPSVKSSQIWKRFAPCLTCFAISSFSNHSRAAPSPPRVPHESTPPRRNKEVVSSTKRRTWFLYGPVTRPCFPGDELTEKSRKRVFFARAGWNITRLSSPLTPTSLHILDDVTPAVVISDIFASSSRSSPRHVAKENSDERESEREMETFSMTLEYPPTQTH